MNLTRGQLRMLMAMYLRVDSNTFDPESQQVYVSESLPSERGSRIDIALEAEAGATRSLSVADGFRHLTSGDGHDSLVAMRARSQRSYDAQVRYGEIYVLDSEPRRVPLPSPYRRASGTLKLHEDLHVSPDEQLDVSIAWKDRVIAGGTIRKCGDSPFAVGGVHVAREHRGRGLGAYIAVVTAQRIRALGMCPVTMVSDNESESRWTLRWIGFERAARIGALSIQKDEKDAMDQ